MSDEDEQRKRTIQLLLASIAIAITIFVTAADLVEKIRSSISIISERNAVLEREVAANNATALEWKQRIVENEKAVKRVELKCTAIENALSLATDKNLRLRLNILGYGDKNE